MMLRAALIVLMISAVPAFAQVPSRQVAGEITSQPICTYLVNRSDQTIMGSISTKAQKLDDGSMAAHTENFKLVAGDRRQFCAAGPFFEGRRLELTLRTLIPLFSCYTKIDREIFLDAKPGPGGFKKLSATCY